MTPAARLSAAMDILDRVLAGAPAEQALTNWGRASRYAGSGDRAAVRDLVFGALRCRRSFAALGGGLTGRGLILGGLRAAGQDPATLCTGEGHGPAPLTPGDAGRPPTSDEALDLPDWLIPVLRSSLPGQADAVAQALRDRAPVFLRANLLRTTRDGAIAALAEDGIRAVPHPLSDTALEVTHNARKVQSSAAWSAGLVELQDAASQAVVDALPLRDGLRVLDYCAGGGGKTLAMAARADLTLFAHDADPGRMRDLPVRATRAGVAVNALDTAATRRAAPFDLVLIDVPCSGSGSWRRAPEAKWALTPDRLRALTETQAAILDLAAGLVGPGGWLCYATCSLIAAENRARIDGFLARHPGWHCAGDRQWTPLDGGDGFYLARLTR